VEQASPQSEETNTIRKLKIEKATHQSKATTEKTTLTAIKVVLPVSSNVLMLVL
jgi:hypothetical protein